MDSKPCCKTEKTPAISLDIPAPSLSPDQKWSRFYPLATTFFFVIGGAGITQATSFDVYNFMSNLMGILLLTFSYLKLLNPKGFRMSFAKYDLVAFYIPIYGYVYPWIELTLGVFYCLHLYSLIINSLTIFVLVINISQVLRALFLKKSLECACMGSLGFKLPLSYVTISEDLVMIVMASVMIGIQ